MGRHRSPSRRHWKEPRGVDRLRGLCVVFGVHWAVRALGCSLAPRHVEVAGITVESPTSPQRLASVSSTIGLSIVVHPKPINRTLGSTILLLRFMLAIQLRRDIYKVSGAAFGEPAGIPIPMDFRSMA